MRAYLLTTTALAAALLLSAGCDQTPGMMGELPQPYFADPDPLPPVAPIRPVHTVATTSNISTPVNPPVMINRPTRQRLTDYDAAWDRHASTRAWKYIIIHHSGKPNGNAETFDQYHRNVRGWDELGYHFVIDNGNGGPNGRVEIGGRWEKQKHGAHCKTNDQRFNNYGIGICLVGNLDNGGPTRAQLDSLNRLVRYLVVHYDIPPQNILGHGEAVATVNEGRATHCPGARFDMDALRRFAQSVQGRYSD